MFPQYGLIASRVRPEWVTPTPDGSHEITRETLTDWIHAQGDSLVLHDHFYPWLVFFGVLPPDLPSWQPAFESAVANYLSRAQSRPDWPEKRFPKSTTIDSFGDDRLMGSIFVDVIRTGRIIYFLPAAGPSPIGPCDDAYFEKHIHLRRIERVIWLFATANGDRYCQGWNELVALLYLVMVKGIWNNGAYLSLMEGCEPLDQAEAMTYCCFERLMSGCNLLKVYSVDDDTASTGFLNEFERLADRLLKGTMDLLRQHQITNIYYALRWFTLLFSQEYDLGSLFYIWDELFIHCDEFLEFLMFVGVAQLECIARQFQDESYRKVLSAIQRGKVKHVWDVLTEAKLNWENNRHEKSQGWGEWFGSMVTKVSSLKPWA